MSYSILSDCWEYDVLLSVVDGNIKANYKKACFPDELRFQIKQNKPLLIERIIQNELLKGDNWIVYHFGDIYEYHLSLRSYLYIERGEERLFTLWRNTEKSIGEDQSKVLLSEAIFGDVYAKATDYINWWTSRKRQAVI